MTNFEPGPAYPPAAESDWMALVERILGPEASENLNYLTREGLRIEPLYSQREPGRHVAPANRRWRVMQRVDHPDPDVANRIAHEDLAGGADGLEVVLPGSCEANGYGVGIETLDDLDRLLAGIDLEQVPLRLDGGYEIRSVMALMVALVERRGCDYSRVDVVGQSDPPNGLFAYGRLTARIETICDWGADIVHALTARALNMSLFTADGRSVHAGGGSAAQELAYVIANGVEHLRMLEKREVRLENAARQITFTLAADADQFMTIAKFRAFRLLWARVTELAGLPQEPARLNGETAWRMMTRRDPWVNILRATIATSGAGIGGADTIVVLPFTSAIGLPDSFARRLARNTQLVLLHEAGLAEVADPAAGSGYVEALTEGLAERAWEMFRAIEREGGLVPVLRNGSFQNQVLKTRQEFLSDVATRREPILGVSEHARLAEIPVRTLDADGPLVRTSGTALALPEAGRGARFEALVTAGRSGASLADMHAVTGGQWEHAQSVPKLRLAEPYERLREASDRHFKATGERPKVFLATMGNPVDYGARAAWATNMLAAGGVEAVTGPSVSVGEAADAFRRSGTRLAFLCSSDEIYAEQADAVATALEGMGALAVYRVGEPDSATGAAAIGGCLHAGCDIIDVLEGIHRLIGVDEVVEFRADEAS